VETRFSQTDVVVVGGGMAGLTAACYLARAQMEVTFIEKASNLGGRAVTQDFDGFPVQPRRACPLHWWYDLADIGGARRLIRLRHPETDFRDAGRQDEPLPGGSGVGGRLAFAEKGGHQFRKVNRCAVFEMRYRGRGAYPPIMSANSSANVIAVLSS
jgi:glycine/D-amino acid oxidase-like deaminating enzyme